MAISNTGTFPVNEFGLQFYETVKPVEARDKGYNTFLISDATSGFP